jgi:hypothetical protein
MTFYEWLSVLIAATAVTIQGIKAWKETRKK